MHCHPLAGVWARPLRADLLLAPGDLLCVHDAGAYGASMASRYNGMPLPAEVLV